MKVAIITWEFPPENEGGLGVHCFNLAKALAGKGVEVDVYAPKECDCPGVNVIGVFNHSKWGYSFSEEGRKDFQNFVKTLESYNSAACEKIGNKRYDIVHFHDWLTVPSGIALKGKGMKTVFTIHSTEYDRTANNSPWEFIIGKEKEGLSSADRIITVSGVSKRHICDKLSADCGKIDVIHNAVDHSEFIKDGNRGSGTVLFLGRLTNQKGPEFFLQAAKRVSEVSDELGLNDIKFIIAGRGYMLPELIDKSIDLGISDSVVFAGRISDREVKELYSISDVYVMPSVCEPFGITALEAMSSGAPVIISKTSGAAEAVSNILKTEFWDTDDMANKIISVLLRRPLLECLSENGMKEAESVTWDSVAEKTIKAYEKAIS